MLMGVPGHPAKSMFVVAGHLRDAIMMSMPTCDGRRCSQMELIRRAGHGRAHRAPDGEQHGKQQQQPDAQDFHGSHVSTRFRQPV